MHRNTMVAAALAAAFSTQVFAADDSDVRELRDQLRQLREQYEQHIQALGKRLEALQARDKPAEPPLGNAAVPAQQPSRAENAFNPAISLILNGTYGNLSQDPN